MIAMYWKFGTGDAGVAMRVKVGKVVSVGKNVGVGERGVIVAVAEGTGDAMLGGAEVAQAVSQANKKIQVPNRFMKPLVK
jgi:hypothetical protein